MSNPHDYEGLAAEYRHESNQRASRPKVGGRRTASQSHRRGQAPQSFNGMHRRRRRKMSW